MDEQTGAADRSELTREGVAHLQAAGRELIDAGRAFLEVAEELLADPEDLRRAVLALRETLASLLDQLLAAVEEKADGDAGGAAGIEKIEVK